MTWNFRLFVISVIIAVVVGLVLVALVGPFLVTMKAPPLVTIGDFCTNWGWVVGILVGVWHYFTGGSFIHTA